MSQPDFTSFSPIYDWSLLEKAVQQHYVDTELYVAPPPDTDPAREKWMPPFGSIPFFTALESSLFQKHTPRLSVDINEISPLKSTPQGIIDFDGVIRNQAWKANMIFTVVTAPEYKLHCAHRAQAMSLAQLICPLVGDPTKRIGVNQYLEYHQFNWCVDAANSTGIHPEQGFYISPINFQIIFSVQKQKWPGGAQ